MYCSLLGFGRDLVAAGCKECRVGVWLLDSLHARVFALHAEEVGV